MSSSTLSYIARRILWAVPTLLLVATLVFVMLRLIPGDPAIVLLGDDGTPQQIADLRAQYGLDKPVTIQFLLWLSHAKTKQTEIGYKHQLGGLLLQGAFFNIDKAFPVAAATDYCGTTKTAAEDAAHAADPTKTQVVGLQFGPNLWCVANQTQGGAVRYRGFELAASGDINRNFGMVASAMFMNAKVTDDPSPPATNLE